MIRVNGCGLLPLLLLVATAQAAVQRYPPLDQLQGLEHPNLRLSSRADEPNYRLPNETLPEQYAVELTTNVHTGDTSFDGIVNIDINVVSDTMQIVLHQRQLTIKKATIISMETGSSAIDLKWDYEEAREFLTLTAATGSLALKSGTTWQLTISYNGTLRSDNGGFYLSTYTDEEGKTKYLATTQFESTDARHAFPCYDEPAKRANFTITIKHDASYNAISNMPQDTELSKPGTTVFETTVKMPTYLVAFIVSDFVYTEGAMNNLPQRVFSRKGTEHEQEWALTTGMLVEKRLSEYLDVPFALPKLDQAAIPDFAAGAMENWGMATYREEYLLYNTKTSTVNTQTNIATIEAHEDAHMWFGDLVAIEWWSFLWLKEGFATLFENLAVDLAYPEWDIFQLFHVSSYQRAMNVDADPNIRPMTHFAQKPNEISMLYDGIAYAKAGSVLDMWRHALTNEVFQRGLTNYLRANQYSAANEDLLFEAIALAAKEENHAVPEQVAIMLRSWTQQSGVPLLTVERNYEDGSFTVTQQRYSNDKESKSDQAWCVPINYAVQSNPDFRDTEATQFLINNPALTLSNAKLNSDEWLILNKQSTGYYHINYDQRNWQLITEGLLKNHHKIHVRNRAQLISDLYSFSSTDRVGHSTLLNLLTYLPREDQYAPWATANSVIAAFNRYLSGDPEYDNFKFYVSELVSAQHDKFGINDVHGEQHLAKYTRNVLINLACMAGVDNCLKDTNSQLQALVDHGTPIEPNLQSQVYCNGLKQSTDKVFDFVYNKLMDSNDQAERRLLISSLGCAQKESQLTTFVSSTIDESNRLRPQERITLLNSAYARGEVGLLTSIEFLLENWEAYAKLNTGFGGVNPLYADIIGMSNYVVNTKQKQKLQELVDKVKGSDYVPDTLQDSVDVMVNANFDWLKANGTPIMNWLASYRLGGNDGSAALSASFTVIIAMLGVLAARLF